MIETLTLVLLILVELVSINVVEPKDGCDDQVTFPSGDGSLPQHQPLERTAYASEEH